MGSFKIVLGVVMAAVLVCGFTGISRAEDLTAKVKVAMQMLKDKSVAGGAVKLADGTLSFGDVEINGNYDIVDEVAEANGCTATVFVAKDGGFQRISTNVIKDGNRAIGTMLADASPAMEPLKKGEAYYGPADILGSKYETGYEPIKDASGVIVGVYYVGYKL